MSFGLDGWLMNDDEVLFCFWDIGFPVELGAGAVEVPALVELPVWVFETRVFDNFWVIVERNLAKSVISVSVSPWQN